MMPEQILINSDREHSTMCGWYAVYAAGIAFRSVATRCHLGACSMGCYVYDQEFRIANNMCARTREYMYMTHCLPSTAGVV